MKLLLLLADRGRYGLILTALWLGSTPSLRAQNALMLRDTVVYPEHYEQRGDWFKVRQWGLTAGVMRDRALSPLRYDGFGLLLNNHQYRFKPRTFVHQQWLFSSTSFARTESDNLLSQISAEFIHARHRPIPLANTKTQLYVGGFVSGLFNLRTNINNVNNVVSYELAASVGPSAMVQFPALVFGKRWVISNELHFPLISLLGNTPYAWPLPTTFDEGGRLGDAFTVGSWGKLLRVTNQLNVDFHRRIRRRRRVVKRVAYRVSYRWEFTSVAEPNLYQSGTHSLSLSRIIAL